MAHLPAGHPATPLDELRSFLDDFADGDTAFPVHLQQSLQKLKHQSLPEIGRRLGLPTTPRALKRALVGMVAKFDWPDWAPVLHEALVQEPDLTVFDEGCAALGRLEIRSAWNAFQDLLAKRDDPDRRLIVNREINAMEAGQSFGFYLGRLLEGEGNARLAHQGARGLAALAGVGDIPALVDALSGADPLSSRLILRILGDLPEGGPTALELFRAVRTGLQDLSELEKLLDRLPPMPRNTARAELAELLCTRLQGRAPDDAVALQMALAGSEGDPLAPLERMKAHLEGVLEPVMAEGLELLLEGKVARFNAFLSERQDETAKRQTVLTARFELLAEGLVQQVLRGLLPAEEVLPELAEAFQRLPQVDASVAPFGRLVPPDRKDLLALVLKEPDLKRRQLCLDVIGAREEDAFVPFFLEAMGDPIVEVGQRAIHHMGKLPSSFPMVLSLFQGGQTEQMRTAIRVFGENRTRAAAEPLIEFLKSDHRDDLVVEAVEALGAIRYPPAAEVLLEMLHDGKPAKLQLALAQSLAALHTPEAGKGFLQKAPTLKLSLALILALECALAAFPDFSHPIPMDLLPLLDQLLERCCSEREGEGQGLRAILATQRLYCYDQDFYTRWKDRFSDVLFDLRTKGAWDRETNDAVAAVVKELGRRSASLNLIASKEAAIRQSLKGVPPAGQGRGPALLALREALGDPELILRPELAREVGDFVLEELRRKNQDWRELARLCEIGGLSGQAELTDSLLDQYHRATGVGLRSAAREALLKLGLTEADIARKPKVHSILIYEPSAFFRKRLRGALEGGGWTVREAGERAEAETLLKEVPVDLVISEFRDTGGELRSWLEGLWDDQRCRQVLLSTSSRDLEEVHGAPWFAGVVYKPYAPDQLIRALDA